MRLLGIMLLAASIIGTLCLGFAAVRLRGHARCPAAGPARPDAVSILKPLHGDEPRLFDNLASFLGQDHGGAIQLVCGVQDACDGAIAVVERLRAAHPAADIALVVDATRHGANAKIGNLINLAKVARHPILILSDSDMTVARDYLRQVTAALDRPGVGAVTCAYIGRGDAGGWSRLAAMAIGQHFLPSVLLGTALGLAAPCMGSTIALSRATLDRIGGFVAFADLIADDHAIGAAVRGLGLHVALAPPLPVHGCTETSFRALWRHELRWNRTVRAIDPWGFAGSIILQPLPLALAGGVLGGFGGWAIAAIGGALAVRLIIALLVDRVAGFGVAPLYWVTVRDMLSVAVYFATFLARSVDWRGAAFTIGRDGRLEDDTR